VSHDSSMIYDGTFDLTFLRDGETVSAAGDGSGACYVTQPTGPDTANGFRVDIGDTVERLPSGWLFAYDADPPHLYVSTACQHGEHGQCRRTCKFCPAFCRCECHGKELP
jgi:hypothetical protein